MNNLDNLYKTIRLISKEKRITQRELAEKINIKESDLKSPTKKLSISSLMKICKILDIELSDLLKKEVL